MFMNSKITSLVRLGLYSDALLFYSSNPLFPLHASLFTFPSLLKACASLSLLSYGKTIHSSIITLGFHSDPFITTSLISMYVKCNSLFHATQVFDHVSHPDPTLWNSIIDGFFRFGYIKEGVEHLGRMQSMGLRPDPYSLSILLGVLGYVQGKQTHGYILRNIFMDDPFLETALIDMYFTCTRPIDALRVFDNLSDKSNVVAWNVMIGGFCSNGLCDYSLEIYSLAKNENVKLVPASFCTTLGACHGGYVNFGRQVHTDTIKLGFQNHPYVCTSILTMYAKCNFIGDAQKVLYQNSNKEVEIWNAMMAAYVTSGCAHDAWEVYSQMRLRGIWSDYFTVSSILSSCSMIESYDKGRMVHAELIKRPIQTNVAVQSALLTMYFKCGNNEDASLVFSTMKEQDVIAWGSVISGFCQNKKYKEAFHFFRVMEAEGVKPDSDIMASVISACVGVQNELFGFSIHGLIIKRGLDSDVFVATSLIDMYSRYGFVERAESIFCYMPYKNLVAWNSMIVCYCRNDLLEFSVSHFSTMVRLGIYPDSVSFTSVIIAVSSVAALLKGKGLHGYLIRVEIPSDINLENALIDMYMKCGNLKYAHHIFQYMLCRNSVTWNSMIAGFGSHGQCLPAMKLFDEMKSTGVTPDDVTFLSLISSCSHSGMVKEGLKLFCMMRDEYGIEPKMEHYVSIIDLFSRAGRLEDAYNFVQKMPIEPDRSVWLSLLWACRAHRNVDLGELAAHKLLQIEPNRGSNYVQVLNMYEEAELRDRAANLRASMKDRGLRKNPGCSWIELRNRVDVFFSGDSSTPRTVEIYEALSSLRRNMKKKGDNGEGYEIF